MQNLLRVIAVAVTAPLLHAQITPLELSSFVSSLETVEPLGEDLHYRAAAVGDLDGNLDPDIVYALDDDVIVFMNVTVNASSFLLGRVANDLVILPDASGGGDRLVLADGEGVLVMRFAFDFPAQEWTPTEDRVGPLSPLGVASLAVGQLDGVNGPDLVGLGGTGRRLVALLDDPSAPGGLAPDPAMSTANIPQAWDVCAPRLDGPEPRIVTVGAAGMGVFDRYGEPLGSVPYAATHGAITLLGGPQRDKVAWFRPSATGSEDDLVILDQNGLTSPTPLDVRVVAANSGDFDGDADVDLAVSVDSAGEIRIIENLGSQFSSQTLRLPNGNLPSTGNMAEPVVADLDLDGKPDAAMADFGSHMLSVFLNDDYAQYDVLTPEVVYLNFAGERFVRWVFHPYDHHLELPVGTTHVRLRVYNQHPDPTHGWYRPYSDAVPFETQWAHLDGETWYLDFDPEGPNVLDETDYVTYVETRYLEVRGGNLVAKHPPYWFGIVHEDNTEAIQYMMNHFPHDIFLPEQIGNGETVGGGAGPPPAPPPGPGGGG